MNLTMNEVMYMHACKIAVDSIRKKLSEKMIPDTGLSKQEIDDCLWIVRYEEETQKKEAEDKNVNDPKSI